MEKRKIITISIYSVLVLCLSYFTFMAFQGLLTIVSKEGAVILPLLGVALNIFVLPSLVVFGYHYLFKNPENKKKLLFKNGLYLTVGGAITTILMLIATITWKNWGKGGPTPLYPIDFLLIDALITVSGVYAIILSRKQEKVDSSKGGVKYFFSRAGVYIFVFLALDRVGAVLKSVFTGVEAFDVLFVVYLLCLAPMVGVVFNALYKVSEDEKKKSRYWLIGSSVSFGLSVVGTIYLVAMLLGDLATPFMKASSVFNGLDRISSLPITMSLVSAIAIITSGVYLIKWFVRKK